MKCGIVGARKVLERLSGEHHGSTCSRWQVTVVGTGEVGGYRCQGETANIYRGFMTRQLSPSLPPPPSLSILPDTTHHAPPHH